MVPWALDLGLNKGMGLVYGLKIQAEQQSRLSVVGSKGGAAAVDAEIRLGRLGVKAD